MLIRPTDPTQEPTFEPLLHESLEQGYTFINKLLDEFESGVNRFDSRGALLLGVYDGQRMVGVGGVCRDHYLNDDAIGRIQHVYVLNAHRRSGVGRMLLDALIEHARGHFQVLTLRTLTDHGDAFYKSLGFTDVPRYEQATHWMKLS